MNGKKKEKMCSPSESVNFYVNTINIFRRLIFFVVVFVPLLLYTFPLTKLPVLWTLLFCVSLSLFTPVFKKILKRIFFLKIVIIDMLSDIKPRIEKATLKL